MEFAAGGLSGLVEVFITHPVDSWKTHSQVVRSGGKWRPFAGIGPRLAGVVPMRVLFWGSMMTLGDHMHPMAAGAITGALQTCIDAPIENAKIGKMLGVPTAHFRGFLPHCARNVGFAAAVAASLPLGLGPLGAVVGTVLTHPLDTLKTSAQSGLARRSLMSGMLPRTTQAVVAIAVGQTVHKLVLGEKGDDAE